MKAGPSLTRRIRLTPQVLINAGTFDASTLEVWDGDEFEYALRMEHWAQRERDTMASGSTDETQTWTLWISGAGATGIWFARGRLNATNTLLVHAAPEKLTVEIHDANGNRIALGESLSATGDTPMARLRREGDRVTREDVWPVEADNGTPVIVTGGEVGILQRWWNAPDHSEWRWSIELYNHR